MGKIKIPYYAVIKGRGYWQPKAAMKPLGFENTPCGPDGPVAWAKAQSLSKKWKEFSSERKKAPPAVPKRGSLGEALARYKATMEWKKKAPRTREEWERVWARIEPIFGDVIPSTIEMDQVSLFRQSIINEVSQREAHRCIKIWRALWQVAASLKYCKADEDPSFGVRNTEPERRRAAWSYGEVRVLVKTAWRERYFGLAAIMAVAWDSSLSPVDVRKLTPAQRMKDDQGDVFSLDRAKTGREAVATFSRVSARIVDAYVARLDVEVTPTAPIFRNRSGNPYSKDTLGEDFRKVRTLAFGLKETRTLADFRRSGAIEALRGGASLTLVGQKLANDVGSNPGLARTYTPVDLAAIRAVDKARKDGRKKQSSEEIRGKI